MRYLVKYLKHPERKLLLEAMLLLALARLVILIMPFRRLAPCLGVHMAATPELPVLRQAELVRRIGRAVENAARHAPPRQARCLPQALAAKFMLRRRGLASTLYLGISKKDNNLKAHAWLRVGDTIVTGRSEMRHYTIISTFAS